MTTPAEAHYAPPGARRWLAYFALLFGNFIAILDIQIVASSLNEIQAGLSATREEISWIQTAYLIAEVIAIPLSGYLARMMSSHAYFSLCAMSFTIASLACAWSSSIEEMIVWRAIQGFCGGGMIPTTYAAMFFLFRPEERTISLVLIGLVSTLAPTMGPTLGGYLTTLGSWQWLFLINLLPGTLVTIAVWNLLRIDRPDWRLARLIDIPALLGMALFLGCLQYVVEEGQRKDWFNDATIVVLTAASLLGAIVFFYRCLRSAEPLVDLRTFNDRSFALGCFYSFMLGLGMFGSTYMIPLFLGEVRNFNAMQIGETMIVTGVTMFLAAPISGAVSSRLDPRGAMVVGLSCLGLSLYFNAHLTAQAGFDQLFLPQILRGLGIIFCIVPLSELAMGTLPQHLVQNGSALFNLMRNLGGAIGLALISTLLSNQQHLHAARLGETMDPGDWHLDAALHLATQAENLPPGTDATSTTLLTMAKMLHQQALVMAFNDVMLVCAGLFAIALPGLLLFKRPLRPAASSD